MERLVRLLPVVAVVLAATLAAWWWRSDRAGDEEAPRRDITATVARFETLEELVAAADVVVEGTVTAVDEGRTISDPTDPATGIVTQLAQLEVDGTFHGQAPATLLVEQEAALLDGTPITVNGVAPLEVGDRAVFVLVAGTSEEFPYTALVSEQGLFHLDGDPETGNDETVRAADADGPIGERYDGAPADVLRADLRAIGSGVTDETG